MLYFYDPRTNVKTPTTYDQAAKITGNSRSSLVSGKSRGKKIRTINCYLIDDKTPRKQLREWYEKEVFKGEIWLEVIGSDGEFYVSNHGRFKRQYKNHQGLLMPYYRKKSNNMGIKVKFKGVYKEYRVTTIVATHFIREPKGNERVIHKNGIRTDDFAGNLEIVTLQELGKRTGYKAKSRPVIQLDTETGKVINEFRSIREAGRQCYISHEAIRQCVIGINKTSGGFKWMYADEFEKMMEVQHEVCC